MFPRILREIARPHWARIILEIKQSDGGLSVPELAARMKMSYMGIKKHCVALDKLGYLTTWRQPKQVGRPEKIYRLGEKAALLFPGIGDDMALALLETATQFDFNAAEKLFFAYFQKRAEHYAKKATGESVADRARELAKLRDREGHLSRCVEEAGNGLRIVEFHNPLQAIFARYPNVERMEEQLFERLLGAPVTRVEIESAGGQRRVEFAIGG